MWPDLVVGRAPCGPGHPGLMQGLEPTLVQVLVAALAIEALDVAVLYEAPRLVKSGPLSMRTTCGYPRNSAARSSTRAPCSPDDTVRPMRARLDGPPAAKPVRPVAL